MTIAPGRKTRSQLFRSKIGERGTGAKNVAFAVYV